MFHNNIVKMSEKLNKRKLLKICLQVTYPTDFYIICIHFYYGKSENTWFFKNSVTRIKLFLHGFALNHDKSLQIYFFCIQR